MPFFGRPGRALVKRPLFTTRLNKEANTHIHPRSQETI
jgi:hypothetical protein